MGDLKDKKCVPCEGGTAPFTEEMTKQFLSRVNDWKLDGKWISKEYKLKNFVEAVKFVDNVAELAEKEGHHPDIHIFYSRVKFDIWTHAIDGLSENDFIIAAKIDALTHNG